MSIKTKDTSERNIATLGYKLRYKDSSSDKEYRVFITETNVAITQWGRTGTEGQSSGALYPTYAQAESAGMKQYHAKAHKGYKVEIEGMRFMASEDAIERARQKDHTLLQQQFHQAHASGEFTGKRDAVFKHYDEFTRKAQDVLDAAMAGTTTGAEALEQVGALLDIWADIEEKHNEVAVTLKMAQGVALQRLAGANA
jgi:predicted DNA-binding WGR domain protein